MIESQIQAAVVIVGAGPAGLLLACELGRRGIRVLVVEEKLGLVRHPKANTQSARAMEIYRKCGVSQKIRSIGLPAERATDVGYFTRLFGHELFRVSLPSPREAAAAVRAGDQRWPTPEPPYRITQMLVEPPLLERALEFPSVTVQFGWKAVELTQDDRQVTLTLEQVETGVRQSVVADYAAGCDGGRSFVRKAVGIRFRGEGGLEMDFLGGYMLATYFRAPTLLPLFPHPDTWMHWIMQPEGRSILLVIDPGAAEFLVHFQLNPQQTAADIDFSARLAAIVGVPVPHEIISSAVWRAGIGLVVEHYSKRRCFLVGDAAHLFTPTGGFGLNTGIEDAFNLGWKLAAVCSGKASPRILETYETERLPIGHRNARYALELAKRNGGCPVSSALDDPGVEGRDARAATTAHLAKFARWEFDTPGVQLGARYDGSPIIFGDEAAAPKDSPTTYTPSGVPGGRLPHVWLRGGRSLFDSLGAEFTLIEFTSDSPEPWKRAARKSALDLTVLNLPDEKALRTLVGAQSVLVRPDQHIAWRGDAHAVDAENILHIAAGVEPANRTQTQGTQNA